MRSIAAIIIALVIIGGVYLVVKGQSANQNGVRQAPATGAASTSVTPMPSPTAQPVSSSSVSMDEKVEFNADGFSPVSVTIKSGGTVTWTNKSSESMWVASDPHPTHTDYPGFDAKKEIPTDGTYSFTFTKAGTWGYHDHLNPSIRGEVVVKP